MSENQNTSLFCTPRGGTALSKNSERSDLIKNKESPLCFIRVGVPNVKDEPRRDAAPTLALATGSASSGLG
jgi:hypothetical protein